MDIKILDARHHLAAACEDAIVLHWVTIDSKQYHRDAFWKHMAYAMDHLGFDMVARVTPQRAYEDQIAKRAAEDRSFHPDSTTKETKDREIEEIWISAWRKMCEQLNIVTADLEDIETWESLLTLIDQKAALAKKATDK